MQMRCKGCGESKSIDEFYACNKSWCRECLKARSREYRRANIEHWREYDRRRAFRKDRVLARRRYQEEKRNDKSYMREHNRRSREWRERHATKRRAHVIISNALRSGRIQRQPCEVCGSPNSEAHHEDYTRPMEVQWLCRKHHMLRHREINAEIRDHPDKWLRRGFTPYQYPETLARETDQ